MNTKSFFAFARKHWILSLFVFAAFMSGFNSAFETEEVPPPAPTIEVPDKIEAYVISQQFVKQHFDLPSTAKFAIADFSFIAHDDGSFTIEGKWELSDQVFRYRAMLKYNGSGQIADKTNWTLENITQL